MRIGSRLRTSWRAIPRRNGSGPRALVVAVTVLAPLVVAPAAQAAPTDSVVTLMFSNVRVYGSDARPVGAILTIINTCPDGSVLDRRFLQTLEPDWGTLNPTRATGFTFLSREWWPSGLVTRWQVTSQANGKVRQAIACREQVSPGTVEHRTHISIKLRLWGPVTRATRLLVDSGFAVWRGQERMAHDVLRLRASTNTLAAKATIEEYDQDAFYGNGKITRSYQGGRYAEFRFSTQVRTPGQNCIDCGDTS